MAQFGRPSADTHKGNWSGDPDNTNLFENLNDATANDASFVQSEFAPASSPYVTKLSNMTDPGVNTGHVVRYRYYKDPSAGAQVNLVVELRKNYVSEASQGTLIASATHNDIPGGVTAGSISLSTMEADAITGAEYEDLYLRFVATQV
jgi:hypothetical protein